MEEKTFIVSMIRSIVSVSITVRNLSVSLSLPLDKNEKVEQYIRKERRPINLLP